MEDVLQYEAKRCIVTGAASGMGAATVEILKELGAEVHGLDIRTGDGPADSFHQCDLGDTGQIDAAVAAVGGPVDCLFNCAGLPTTADDRQIMLVNFWGHRHLTEAVIPNMPSGGSIAFISSVAGMAWLTNAATVMPLAMAPDRAAVDTWLDDNEPAYRGNGYGCSKEVINAYVAWRGFQLAPEGIRLNGLNPGPTDTPMMPHFIETQGQEFFDKFPKPIGRNSRPDEQAWVLVMLNSPRSSYVTATSVFADGGFTGGLFTGGVDISIMLPSED